MRVYSREGGAHTLSVYALDGSLHHRRTVELHVGETVLSLEASAFLDEQPGAGVYLVEITRGAVRAVRKIIVREAR
jgi:hypothetical protein